MSEYGYKLNPYRNLRKPRGIKGTRRSIRITHNPDKAEQGTTVPVRFPDIGLNDVIVPGSSRLSFKIDLTSEGGNADANRTVVNNLGRAILSTIVVRLEARTIFELVDTDIFLCYQDLWKTTPKKKKMRCIKASKVWPAERSESGPETPVRSRKTWLSARPSVTCSTFLWTLRYWSLRTLSSRKLSTTGCLTS